MSDVDRSKDSVTTPATGILANTEYPVAKLCGPDDSHLEVAA